MAMQGTLLETDQEFQDGKSRALYHTPGTSLVKVRGKKEDRGRRVNLYSYSNVSSAQVISF